MADREVKYSIQLPPREARRSALNYIERELRAQFI